MYITKDQLKQIIGNAPAGSRPEVLLREIVARGNVVEGFNEPKEGILKSIAKAVVNPVAKFGVQAANTVESTYKLATGDISGANEAMNKTRVLPGLGAVSPYVKGSDTNAQAIKGTLAGGFEIGSLIAPVGKVGTSAKALAGAAGRFGAASGIGDIGSQLTNGKKYDVGQTIGSVLIGGAIPIAGRVLSKGLSTAGKVTSEVLGKTTGTNAEVVREAFNNPNVMKLARKAGSQGESELQDQALEGAKSGFAQLLKSRNANYTKQLEQVKANKSDITSIISAGRDKAKSLLNDFSIKLESGNKLNNLNFDNSTITKNTKVVQKAVNDVLSWTENTPAGVDKLKKKLSQYINEIPVTESGGAKAFLVDLYDTIKSGLNEKVPGYQEMTKGYHEASNLIEEVQKALSLGDKVSKDTAIRKIMSTMRDNNELRKDFLKLLGTTSGKDITGTVAASALTKFAPHGIAGRVMGGGGALAAGYLKPSSIPILMVAIGSSSPRLVGELANITGKATRQMIKADKFSPAIRNTLRIILQKAYSNKNK